MCSDFPAVVESRVEYLLWPEKDDVPQNDDVSTVIQHLCKLNSLIMILTSFNADPQELRVTNRSFCNVSELRFHLLHLRCPNNLPCIFHRYSGAGTRFRIEIAWTEMISGAGDFVIDAFELLPELLSDRDGKKLRETRWYGVVHGSPEEEPPEKASVWGFRRGEVLAVEVDFWNGWWHCGLERRRRQDCVF